VLRELLGRTLPQLYGEYAVTAAQVRRKCVVMHRSCGPVRASLVCVACNCGRNAQQHRHKCDATTIASVIRLSGLQHRL